jgi:hypothetical protein
MLNSSTKRSGGGVGMSGDGRFASRVGNRRAVGAAGEVLVGVGVPAITEEQRARFWARDLE